MNGMNSLNVAQQQTQQGIAERMAEWKKSGNTVEKFHYPWSHHSLAFKLGLKSSDLKSKVRTSHLTFWFVHIIDALLALLVSIHMPSHLDIYTYIYTIPKSRRKQEHVRFLFFLKNWQGSILLSYSNKPLIFWCGKRDCSNCCRRLLGMFPDRNIKHLRVSPFHPSCTSESIQMYLMHLYWHKCLPSLYNTGNVYIVYMMRLETLMERNRCIINSMTHFGHSTTRV